MSEEKKELEPVKDCPQKGKLRHGLKETTAQLRKGQYSCVCSVCKTLIEEHDTIYSCR